jgi:aspartyl-tRNA synthetase
MALDIHKRIYSSEVQNAKEGSAAIVAGWASEVKSLGKIAFIKLRDREGFVQLVSNDAKLIDKIAKISNESVIIAEGKVKLSKLKAGGNELELENFEILSEAEPKLPIDFSGKIETDLSKRLDNRFLDLRNPKRLAIFKVRSEVSRALHEFFRKEDFIEVHTPKTVGSGAEGGATMFTLDYYGKKAYLSQSQQLYKQMLMIAGFEKVFEIGPSFRAEKSHTMRHLAEFDHIDVEMSFIKDEDDIFKLQEKLLVFVLESVKKNCGKELELLAVNIEIPKIPFPRITYADGLVLLKKEGIKAKEIGQEEEVKLGEIVKQKHKTDAFFITKMPKKDVKFYCMIDGNTGRYGDLEYKGNEISSGGQREHRYDILVKQIKEKGLDPEDFEYYTKPFMYGAPPHGGLGMGLDRLTQFILNLSNIREAVLFPRDTERLTP